MGFLVCDSFCDCQELCWRGVVRPSQNIPTLSLVCIYDTPNLIWRGIIFGCYTGVTCGDGSRDVMPTYRYCDGMIHCNL